MPPSMSEEEKDKFIETVEPDDRWVGRYSVEAMNTVFEVMIRHEDMDYAQKAAWNAFDSLGRVEQCLSRFVENSDISRINRMRPGQVLALEVDTFRCLYEALVYYQDTGGLFDVDYRSRQKAAADFTPLDETLSLDMDNMTLTLHGREVDLDLGGIGKGYAVDVLAHDLREWGIERALIHGGSSSVCSMGPKVGWPVNLILPGVPEPVLRGYSLENQALGASGLFKGDHIIDPATGRGLELRRAVWVTAPDAAAADALSTGMMLMEDTQIMEYCHRHPLVGVLRVEWKERAEHYHKRCFGAWPEV